MTRKSLSHVLQNSLQNIDPLQGQVPAIINYPARFQDTPMV